MDLKKILVAISSTPWVANLIIHYGPYFPYIKACTTLVIGDIVLGLLAACYEKYKVVNLATLMRTFKSHKLIKKFVLGVLFFAGLYYMDASSVLLQKLGVDQHDAGIWWCVAYGVYELSSILENMGRLDFPIAKQVKNWINAKMPEDMKDKEEPKDNV